jgi:xanthine dehydrogenase YagS FAD-binding subunit
VTFARIVLGGAAPAPHRARSAEDGIVGGPANAETAEAAAGIATEGMTALAENRYKINVFRALVRRAVAGV